MFSQPIRPGAVHAKARIAGLAALATAALLLVGCNPHYQRTSGDYSWNQEQDEVNLAKEVEKVCSALINDAKGVKKDSDTLLVVSFADLNALEQSSSLGRLMGQQCASEIVNRGYQVTEILLAESVYVDPTQGELLLSRDLEQIASDHDATTVVVGTYSMGAKTVYVTTKVVRSSDARVLSAQNFELPLTPEVRSLLAK